MNWKSWLVAFLIFAGVCVAADLVTTYGLILRMPTFDTNRILRLYQTNPDEIPMFGTSRIHWNYEPASLGLNTYNYGMDSSSFEVTDVLLQIELAKHKNTPIIIEPEFEDPNTVGDPAKFIPLLSDQRFRAPMQKFHVLGWWQYIPGLRYFGYYDVYLHEFLNDRRMTNWRLVKGFSYDTTPPAFDQAQLDKVIAIRLKARNGYFPIEDQENRLIARISGHPERLFFVVYSPYHPSWYAHFENADKLKAFQDRLKALPNVVVIDCSRMKYPDEFFADTVHLRHKGAMDFSSKLRGRIQEVLKQRNVQVASEPGGRARTENDSATP